MIFLFKELIFRFYVKQFLGVVKKKVAMAMPNKLFGMRFGFDFRMNFVFLAAYH